MEELKKIDEMEMSGKITKQQADELRKIIKNKELEKDKILFEFGKKSIGKFNFKKVFWKVSVGLIVVGIIFLLFFRKEICMDRAFLFSIVAMVVFVWFFWELYYVLVYKRFFSLREDVREKWAHIVAYYRQKESLFSSLLEVIKGQLEHEKDIVNFIAKARESLSENVDLKEADSMFRKAFALVEGYPNLKSNELALNLMSEIAVVEDLITEAKIDFNKAVKKYNAFINTFPGVIVAKGSENLKYYEVN